MRITILDRVPLVRPRVANVATEIAQSRGYSYMAVGQPNVKLFLGFAGQMQGSDVIYMNPFWSGNSDPIELLPASQNDVVVTISPEAVRLGARANVQFNGPSPRIKVTFPSPPIGNLNIGTATVGFTGLWPLKGTYFCSDFQSQTPSLMKALEPFGAIILRQTCHRIVAAQIGDAIDHGSCRIDGIDRLSTDFIRDNLAADLCDLIFDDVGNRAVTPKPNVTLPDQMTNSYENNQDGLFTRSVALAI